MYIRNTYNLGEIIDIEHRYPGNFGAPGCRRDKKRKPTPEEVERQNRTNKKNFIRRLILLNFIAGDIWLTLTYRRDKPSDLAEAKANIRKFLGSMRKIYKKAGLPLKYILVTEQGSKGAFHHHLVLEDLTGQVGTWQLIKTLWKHGSPETKPLYEDGNFEKLADYIVKEKKTATRHYTHSRGNLRYPAVIRKTVERKRWPADPKPKKGFYIIKESIYNGKNPVTDRPYQHYSMRRLGNGGGGRGS